MDLLHPRPYPQDAEWEDPAYVDVNLGFPERESDDCMQQSWTSSMDADDFNVERDDGDMVVMGDDGDAAAASGGGAVGGGGGDGGGCGTNGSVPFGSVICPPRNPLMQKARGQGLLRIPWFTATPTRTTMTTTATARRETRKNKNIKNHNKKTTTTATTTKTKNNNL